jgi:hypothetical protein
VRAKVQGAEDVDRDLAVESEALETDGLDFLTVLIERGSLDAEKKGVETNE